MKTRPVSTQSGPDFKRSRAIAATHLEALATRLHREEWPDASIGEVLAEAIAWNEAALRQTMAQTATMLESEGIQELRSLTFSDDRPLVMH